MEALASEVFVGRVRELGQLERALDAARAGSGAAVLVAGEAGIGKTRLASELATRARDAGFQVLLGRSIDLIGTELPYQPFVEALRPLGALPRVDRRTAGSQLRMFEQTLALLSDRAAIAPVMLVLEDLHWADTSTLDLVVFLAHNLDDRRVVLLATYRGDELSSAERVRRLADGVRRSGSALVLELGPLQRVELTALLAAHADAPLPAALRDAIVARSEGNPFFAEELLAAAGDHNGALPRGLRDLLLQRVARLDPVTQSLLRLAAAAGRDVGYPLLRAVAALPERDVRESLRQAVEHGVLVAEQATGSFRFRHALLAEAIYATILPGEREELHAARRRARAQRNRGSGGAGAPLGGGGSQRRGAGRLGRSGTPGGGRVRPGGGARAPGAGARVVARRAGRGRARAARPRRALLLGRRAGQPNGCVAAGGRARAASDRAGRRGRPAARRAPAREPRPLPARKRPRRRRPRRVRARRRAGAGAAALAGASAGAGGARAWTGLAWCYDESLAICEQALALARVVGAHRAELRALTMLGSDLAYVGRGDEGLAQLLEALRLAEASADPVALERAYVALTDVLMMLGRPRESARLAESALDVLRPYGRDHSTLVANRIEALVASGEWGKADSLSAAALRAITANYPHQPLITRAELEVGRGDFDQARAHLDAAAPTVRLDPAVATYDAFAAELALWERRWTDADQTVCHGLARARSRHSAQIRVWLCAKGLRAQADLAGLARARRDADAVGDWLSRARKLLATARRAAAEAAAVTPNAGGWRALAEAEYERARGVARPELWSDAADTWERLERPPLAAYCRWRHAEALVAAGASRAEASGPLREAHAVAARIGARPLAGQLELLAQRARLDLASPDAGSPDGEQGLEEILGLTPREAEVLTLVARGYTNREIAATLVISVRTASVHVLHILRKLGVPNRLEAAAIAHRLSPPHVGQPELEA
jgi:DNA-binding CsgD family transcriptional regulator/tetratricopeptide (TPR) repeat protein